MSVLKGSKRPRQSLLMKKWHAQVGLSDEQRKKIGLAHRGRKRSNETRQRLSASHLGKVPWNKGKKFPHLGEENARAWKGDSVGYGALHDWVRRTFGKPTCCTNENCSYPNPKRFEWANISGQYKRIGSDWQMLCASCHRKYDDIGNRAWTTRLKNGNTHAKLTDSEVRVIKRMNKDQGIGSRRLAKQFRVTPGTIKNVLRGRTWRHVMEHDTAS